MRSGKGQKGAKALNAAPVLSLNKSLTRQKGIYKKSRVTGVTGSGVGHATNRRSKGYTVTRRLHVLL